MALELSKRLGISVYDNELISKAAEESGFCRDLFEKSDEQRSIFQMSGFFSSTRYGLAKNYVGDDELFKMQSDVIRNIAGKQSAIFVGRCSDYILRDMDCSVDVFLTSPMEVRKREVAEREGITLNEAESLIIKKERSRETYYNYFTFCHWGAASNYDLCIDTSLVGIEGTADLILEFARKRGLIDA